MKKRKAIDELLRIMARLRAPTGCPWDKEQTHSTLTQYAIEEAHELADAIDRNDKSAIIEELGDLLLQVILHSEIARQEGSFTLADVISGITQKMVRRHPHVFGDVKVKDSQEVLSQWSKIKEGEKADSKSSSNPFANIPQSLPALIHAQKIGAKSVRLNFDWANAQDVFKKVEEELREVEETLSTKDTKAQQMEIGDLLFSVVQLARHLNFDAEQALRLTNSKFITRFMRMRELVDKDGKIFSNLNVQDLETYWVKAKVFERG